VSAHCQGDGGYFGESKCDCTGFTLCDDFEGASVDSATWMLDSSNGTATIDTTRAARGNCSVKLHITNGAGDRAILNETKSFPAAGNHFWVRAFVFATAPVPQVHCAMFEGSGGNTNVRVGLDHMGLIEPNYISGNTEYGVFNGLTHPAMPTGTWTCLELEYDGPNNAVHTYLNGALQTGIDITGTEMPPWTAPSAYSNLSIGPELFQPDNTASSYDFWVDAVATSNNRVGCDK
jgi:hypothetical protein